MTWVQVCEFELLLKTLASVCPAVFRIWASCQSYDAAAARADRSAVAGPVPEAQGRRARRRDRDRLGEVAVAERLSARSVPSKAAPLPEWALALLAIGGATPPGVHEVSPFSNPPFWTSDALDDGVTALDGADCGPWPFGLDAVTVNVYVVPLVRPVTVAEVGAGDPVTVVGVCATDPM